MKKDRLLSAREVRALLWLLPVLAVASWLVWAIARPSPEKRVTIPDEPILSADARLTTEPDQERIEAHTVVPDSGSAATDVPPSPQYFDPNTVEYHDLLRLGFTRGEALGIVKYRERGKVFEIPEDFAACYQVSEEMYRRLKPYIRIGEEYRLKPFRQSSRPNPAPQNDDTATDAPLSRETHPVPIDINSADSAALILVSGIGAVTAPRIIEYRTRLGGFVSVEQLAEVRGVTEQNYERIVEQIFVDDSAVQKIDINFAPAKVLAAHPYIRAKALRKLLKQRQLKGGWRTPEELEQDDIFTAEEFAKLSPYFAFKLTESIMRDEEQGLRRTEAAAY